MTALSNIYNISSRGNVRGKAKQGFVRPTICEYFDVRCDFKDIPNIAQFIKTTTIEYSNGDFYVGESTEIVTIKLYGAGGGGGGAMLLPPTTFPQYGEYGHPGAYCEKQLVPVIPLQHIKFDIGYHGNWRSSGYTRGSNGYPTKCVALGMEAGGGDGGRGSGIRTQLPAPTAVAFGGDINLSSGGRPGGHGATIMTLEEYPYGIEGAPGINGRVIVEEYYWG